jgi:hypothetical protein
MKYSTGALKSKKDIRDFVYKPDKANWRGGTRYLAKDIEDQSKVGICTSITVTQQARKARGIKYSADFQYLIQKKFVDKNWSEGSATAHGPYVAYKYGLLPEKEWKHTTFADRKKGYKHYIKKLQAIPDKEIDRLLKIAAKHKVVGYQRIVPLTRDTLANAIDESEAGIVTRMECGSTWWTKPIEPLRYPTKIDSGHALTASNYTGGSVRVANTWGDDWADKGTAYYMYKDNTPTEAYIVYYKEKTKLLEKQIKAKDGFWWKVKKFIQKNIL